MNEITYMPCSLDHIRLIKPQNGDSMDKAMFLSPEFSYMIRDSFAISAWLGNVPIAAAGLLNVYNHKMMAWAILGELAGPHMLKLTRKVRQALDVHKDRRIEMLVIADYEPGHRWARLLGFKLETPEPMKMHGVFGQDEMLYARVPG